MGKTRRFKNNKTAYKPTHETNRKRKRQKNPNNYTDFTLSQTSREILVPFVKNLSEIKLTDIQISALAKGLKHIPHQINLLEQN